MPGPWQPADPKFPYAYNADQYGHGPQNKSPTFDLTRTQKQISGGEECGGPSRLRDDELLNGTGDVLGLTYRDGLYDNENTKKRGNCRYGAQ